jgi:hypothetical protein
LHLLCFRMPLWRSGHAGLPASKLNMRCVFLPQSHGRAQADAKVVTPAPKSPIPFEKWPVWARMIWLVRKKEDRGVGDVVERTIGPASSKAFQAWYKRTYGRSCGCSRRKAEWNQQFPF